MAHKLSPTEYTRQRWTVADPFKGYDEEAHYWYIPEDVPVSIRLYEMIQVQAGAELPRDLDIAVPFQLNFKPDGTAKLRSLGNPGGPVGVAINKKIEP